MHESRKLKPSSTLLSLSLFVLSCAGCGGKEATVTGVVTLDSQPVTQGTVAFHKSGSTEQAVGLIQSDGSYELSTKREKGLDAGEYVVTVKARERGEMGPNGSPPIAGKWLTPKRYSNTRTSDLGFSVETGHNSIDLELTSNSQ